MNIAVIIYDGVPRLWSRWDGFFHPLMWGTLDRGI